MPVTFMTGEAAAEQTGLSIAEIDEAAATGAIPAHYTGWQLLVDPSSLMPSEDQPEVEEVESWDQLTVAELKAELQAREIPYPSSALKADLVALLEAET